MKRYIVHKIDIRADIPYELFTVFDGETFEVFEQREFEANGSRAIRPRRHIVVKDESGAQANVLMSEFIEIFDETTVREARLLVSRLNEVHQVMEA